MNTFDNLKMTELLDSAAALDAARREAEPAAAPTGNQTVTAEVQHNPTPEATPETPQEIQAAKPEAAAPDAAPETALAAPPSLPSADWRELGQVSPYTTGFAGPFIGMRVYTAEVIGDTGTAEWVAITTPLSSEPVNPVPLAGVADDEPAAPRFDPGKAVMFVRADTSLGATLKSAAR